MSISAGQLFHDSLFEGQVASGQLDTFYRGTFEEFVNADIVTIPQGSLVIFSQVANAAPGSVVLPTTADVAGGAEFIGVVPAMSFDEKPRDLTDAVGVPVGRPLTILRVGIIGLLVETDLDRGADIYARTADEASPGANERIARIRADAAGGNAVLVPAGRMSVLKNTLAGEIAPVAIDFPHTLV